MPSKVASLLSSVALTGCVLSAQNVTLPSVLDGVEGGSATNIPFGSNLACRYQCIYDANTLPWTGPRLITGIKIRADNGTPLAPGNAIPAKGVVVLSVLMSTTGTSASNASGTFMDNRGLDAQWVLQSHHLQLPSQPSTAPNTGPRPANIDLPFTTPFWYGLTPAHNNQPMPENLLIEIRVESQPAGAYPIDNVGGCVAPQTTFGNQGPACHASGLPVPTLTTSSTMVAGSNFSWTVDNCEPNVGVLLMLDFTNQGFLLGDPQYPLPYPMFDPQNPSQPSAAIAALGWPAPDCWVNVYSGASIFSVADASGIAVIDTPLPAGSQYVGLELFGQALIYSQTANLLQMTSTIGKSSTVCGPLDVARIFAFYNGSGTPTPPPPSTGAVQYGLGMVIEVQ